MPPLSERPSSRNPATDPAAFAALLAEACRAQQLSPPDETLAFFLATHRLGGHPPPAALRRALDRLCAALRNDTALQARTRRLERTLIACAAATDPLAQFERLSGR